MRSTLYVLAAAFMAVSSLSAQEARGTIVGLVTDATSAVIPNAKVDVINKAMGTAQNLTTTDVGFYQATFLIPGQYKIEVQAPGFKKFVRDKQTDPKFAEHEGEGADNFEIDDGFDSNPARLAQAARAGNAQYHRA